MVFKGVSRLKITEMIRNWQADASMRGLACASGLSRNTTKRHPPVADSLGLTRDGPPPTESRRSSPRSSQT